MMFCLLQAEAQRNKAKSRTGLMRTEMGSTWNFRDNPGEGSGRGRRTRDTAERRIFRRVDSNRADASPAAAAVVFELSRITARYSTSTAEAAVACPLFRIDAAEMGFAPLRPVAA
jgi:hypothetical protein